MTRFDPATGPLRGDYLPPPDKSISHRAALFAAMADEPVTVRNYLDSQDTRSTLDALLKLGAAVEEDGPGGILIRGVGLHAPLEATGGMLDVGNSGTLMRLLPGWLAGQPGGAWTLDGDDSIRRRPVDRIAEPLAADGRRGRGARGPLPAVHGARRRADRDHVRDAGAERAGQVVRADRRHACRGLDHGGRGGAQPRPHGAPAAPRAGAVRARGLQVDRLPGGRARAGRDRGAGRPVVGGLHRRRGDARAGLARGGQGRGAELDAHRLLPHRRAHGRGVPRRPRGGRHGERRRAGRRAGRGVEPPGGHRGGAGRGAAGDRRADARGAARRASPTARPS